MSEGIDRTFSPYLRSPILLPLSIHYTTSTSNLHGTSTTYYLSLLILFLARPRVSSSVEHPIVANISIGLTIYCQVQAHWKQNWESLPWYVLTHILPDENMCLILHSLALRYWVQLLLLPNLPLSPLKFCNECRQH